jgi:hypothetical protein
MEGLMSREEVEKTDFHNLAKDFNNAIEYFNETFFTDKNAIVQYYYNNTVEVKKIIEEASRGTGCQINQELSFPDFIVNIDKYMK